MTYRFPDFIEQAAHLQLANNEVNVPGSHSFEPAHLTTLQQQSYCVCIVMMRQY